MGLLPEVFAVKLVPKLIPQPSFNPVDPGVDVSSNALAFNKSVEISGRNKPYDPLSAVYPFPLQGLPSEPLII